LTIDEFTGSPGPQQHRLALLRAGEVYQALATHRGDQPADRLAAAHAHQRVGELRRQLDDLPNAITAYQNAMALLEELCGELPENAALAARLAECRREHERLRQSIAAASRVP
jgi:hypothetical protein